MTIKRMIRIRPHTKWLGLYILAACLLALITGFTPENSSRAENKLLSADAGLFLHGSAAEETPIFVAGLEDFNYFQRLELGYPRIECVLNSYEETIRRYAGRYGFDWRLILAVMNQESRFRIQAVSHRGAYGLMQIMPATGREISAELGIEDVSLPEDNIAGGVYYLWRMHELFRPEVNADETGSFDRMRLALAAYNGGPSRVADAQVLARYLKLNPDRWEIIRDLLPMLSRRYASLHRSVWPGGQPTGGYFEGFNETINYVDRTVEYYSYYRQLFRDEK